MCCYRITWVDSYTFPSIMTFSTMQVCYSRGGCIHREVHCLQGSEFQHSILLWPHRDTWLVLNSKMFGIFYMHAFTCNIILRNWAPMGGALIRLPKWRVGILLRVSTFNHKRTPIYVYSDSLPTNPLTYWTNNVEPSALEAQVLMACNTLNSITPP